jgi:hypothetical protein
MSDISAEIAKIHTKLELIVNEQAVIRAALKELSNQLAVADNGLNLAVATVRTAISDIAVTTGGGKRAVKTTTSTEETAAATTTAAPLAKGYPANRMLWFKTEFKANETFKEDIIKRLNESLKEDVMAKALAEPNVIKPTDPGQKQNAISSAIWGYIRDNGQKPGQPCVAIYNDIDKLYDEGKKAFAATAKTGSVEQTIDAGTPK